MIDRAKEGIKWLALTAPIWLCFLLAFFSSFAITTAKKYGFLPEKTKIKIMRGAHPRIKSAEAAPLNSGPKVSEPVKSSADETPTSVR